MKNQFIRSMAIVMGIMFSTMIAGAQTLEYYLFETAEAKKEMADDDMAYIFSPDTYEKAQECYEAAVEEYNEEGELEDIRENLNDAIRLFTESIQNNDAAKIAFAAVLDARNDAWSVNADNTQKDLWEAAEAQLRDGLDDYEENDFEDAKGDREKAIKLYRKAERKAIESFYLGRARELMEKADDENADFYAPVTYGLAERYIKNTEKALKEKNYDYDEVRQMAKAAEHEARHAIYLNKTIEDLKEKNVSMERYMRIVEQHIGNIASTLNMSVEFDKGIDEPVEAIINKINKTVDSEDNLEAKVYNLTAYTSSLKNLLDYKNEEIELMKERMETNNSNDIRLIVAKIEASEEAQRKLESYIMRQEMLENNYRRIDEMFEEDEAGVYRQGDEVIIRMSDFDFKVGDAKVLKSNDAILNKLEKALNIFENERIVVQGHTDSQGSDDMNIELSRERAKNVKNYITDEMDVDYKSIKAVGFGESRPLANNEHAAGRAKNRRIDIVITPAK